jgi:NTP pyrophosphatase (non-canonical NTP hydrolase)
MNLHELQVKLAKWQADNFGPEVSTVPLLALGMSEEVGELAHAVLKGEQGIRSGTDGIDVEAAVDAVCDTMIYGIQILSKLDVNVELALEETIKTVLARDWKEDPEGSGFSQHKGGNHE